MSQGLIPSFSNSCKVVLDALFQARLAIVKPFWFVSKKIGNIVFFWRSSPFIRTVEQQKVYDLIKNRYNVLETKRTQTQSLNTRTTQLHLNPAELTTNGHTLAQPESQPIQNLRILGRQIAASAVDGAKKNITDPQVKSLIDEVKPLVPVLTDIVSEKVCELIQNISMPNLFDENLDIIRQETKAHIQASSQTEQEKKRIDYFLSIIQRFPEEQAYSPWERTVSPEEYERAVQFIREVNDAGKEPYLRHIYAEAYDKGLQAGLTETAAKGKAHQERIKYAAEIKKNLAKSFEIKVCINHYLKDFYTTQFVICGGTTKVVSEITMKQGIDYQGVQVDEYYNHLKVQAEKLSHVIINLFNSLMNDAALSETFWKKYLKTGMASEVNSAKETLIRDTLKPILTNAIEKALLMAVTPQLLDQQLGSGLYPAVEEGLLATLCKFLVVTKWKEVAPDFFAYNVASDTSRIGLAVQIKDKIYKDLQACEGIEAADIPRAGFDKIMDEMLSSMITDQFAVRQILASVSSTPEYQPVIDNFYDMVITAAAMPSQEQANRKRLEAKASLKAHLLTLVPPSYFQEAYKLPDGNTDIGKRKQQETFHANITPWVDKIEKQLIKIKSEYESTLRPLDKKALSAEIQKVQSDEPTEVLTGFGDLTFDLGLQFGQLAPNLSWYTGFIPWVHGMIKTQIDKAVSVTVAPLRASHHQIINQTVDSLGAQLANKDKTGVDSKKVEELFFSETKKPELQSQKSVANAVDSISRLGFALAMQIPLMLGYGNKITTTVRTVLRACITGNTPAHIDSVINKVHQAYFHNRFINLSRVERIIDGLIANIEETNKELAKKRALGILQVTTMPT